MDPNLVLEHPRRMIALIPLVVALIGLLMWVIPGPPRTALINEIGKILFIIGAFCTVLSYVGNMTKLF